MGGHRASFLFCHHTSQNVTQGKRFWSIRKLYLNAKKAKNKWAQISCSSYFRFIFLLFLIAPISTLIQSATRGWVWPVRPSRIIYIQEIEYGCKPWSAESIGPILLSRATGESSIVGVFKGVQRAATAQLTVFSCIHKKSIVCVWGELQELWRTNQSQINICSWRVDMCMLE